MKVVVTFAVLIGALILINTSSIAGTEPAKSAAGLIFLILMILGYFLPTIIARTRGHPNSAPIGILNFFLGWSFLFWLVALIWSATAIRPRCPLSQP
jgi:drug/metabolite transporter (DMT)-like permease